MNYERAKVYAAALGAKNATLESVLQEKDMQIEYLTKQNDTYRDAVVPVLNEKVKVLYEYSEQQKKNNRRNIWKAASYGALGGLLIGFFFAV